MSKWLLAVVALVAAVPAAAMSVVRVSDEALVDHAPVIVVGQAVAADTAVRGGAATEYTFRVDDVLKGTAGSLLTVRVPGGRAASGMGLVVFGAPRLAPGERTILFLDPRPDGSHRIFHLALGAFYEAFDGGRGYAVRDLEGVEEVSLVAGELASGPAAAGEPLRDFDAFTGWIAARARGEKPGAGGYRAAAAGAGTGAAAPRRVSGQFFLFELDGFNLRWFEFDSGGHVTWNFFQSGEAGLTNDGRNAFKTALNAWNAESQTPVDYRYGTSTNADGGLCDTPPFGECTFNGFDNENVILFGDPNDELDDLISCGGVLAYGGPWLFEGERAWQGEQYIQIAGADIVINNGLACFWATSPDAEKAAAELFAHELGHTLGIHHSCADDDTKVPCNAVEDDALMRAFIHDDNRGARLNSDDQAALRALYKQATTPQPKPAAPSNLVADPTSTTGIQLAWQDNANNETGFRVEVMELGGSFQGIGEVGANATGTLVTGLAPATGYRFRVAATNAAGESAYSNEAQASTDGSTAPCVPDDTTHCLEGGRFRVTVDWANYNNGATGQGMVVPGVSSDDSGLFWFFNPNNWEMLIKVKNACVPVLGNHYWVFFAAVTDVEFWVTVTDTQSGRTASYYNPPQSPADAITDTAALAVCP
jgi:hypothetical protein